MGEPIQMKNGRLVAPEVVSRFPAWLETLPNTVQFVATDITPFRAALVATRFAEASVVTAPRALAAAIARIAGARLLRGEACDPAVLDANYVRRSDAELFWKEC